MKQTLRTLLFVFFSAALCLANGCAERKQTWKPWQHDRTGSGGLSREARIQRSLHDGFDTPPEVYREQTKSIFIVFGLLAAGIVLFLMWYIWQQKIAEAAKNNPNTLFNELCTIHQLSGKEQHILKTIAANNSLACPLQLFVEPRYLLETLHHRNFASSRASVKKLLATLFGITPDSAGLDSGISDSGVSDSKIHASDDMMGASEDQKTITDRSKTA